MTAPFSYHINVGTPVDGRVSEQFLGLCQVMHGAMSAIASEHRKLADKNESLESEVKALRAAAAGVVAEPPATAGDADGGAAEPATALAAAAEPPVRREGGSSPARDAGEGRQLAFESSIKIHEAPVHSVQMDPGLATVATASWDATVKLYDLANGSVVQTLGGEGTEEKMGGLYAVAFSKTQPDILGCTSCDHSVYLWNHTTGSLLAKLKGHSDEVNGIDFHTTQQVMCTASDDCKVIIWDFQEGITLRTLDKHTKAVYGASFLGTEMQYFVATCCFDMKTRVFDMRDKEVVAMLQTHSDDVIGIDYSSTKQLLATGSDDGIIGIWDTRTWKLQQRVNTRDATLPDNEVKRIAFNPSGELLAAACSSGRVLVYDIRTYPARQYASLEGHGDCVFDVTWGKCPETGAQTVVSASHDHTCRYWREVV